MRRIGEVIGLLLAVWRLAAQAPAIAQNGVVNQASQIVPALPGGMLARGALIDIRGVRLTSADGKTAVTLAHGSTPVAVSVLSASLTRIEGLVPPDAPLGLTTLVVTVDRRNSSPLPVEIVASNPGIYSRNGQGWGSGQIINWNAEGKRSENSQENPARPGQRVVIAATGLAPGAAARVVVGGRSTRASVTANRSGKEELVFTVPADSPRGCYVPMYLLAGLKRASNVVTIAISSKGPCSSPFISATGPARVLLAVFSRTVMKSAETAADSIYDEAVVSFASVDADARLSPLMLLPPPGTCIAYSGSFQTTTLLPDSPSAALVSELGGAGLDAGPALNVRRDGANRDISGNPSAPGFFRARLGGKAVLFGPRALPPFLDPGDYRLTVAGGHNVGAFTAPFAGPSPVEWTNRDQIDAIDRGRELRIEWRGAAADRQIIVLATNVDQLSTATGTVLCTALAGADHLTVAPEILANLPVSRGAGDRPYNRLFVGTLPAKIQRVRGPGLDDGAIISLYTTGRYVHYF